MSTGLMCNLFPRLIALACLGMAFCSLPGARAQSQGRGRERSLQSFVVALMRGQRGAVLVTNPMTGEVLAVSNPQISFQLSFPPGSTAKIVESAAALEEGLISPEDRIFCRRIPEMLGEAFHCSHPPAAEPFTLSLALANSCNYFFATLSLRLSSASLAHWYAVFGFGKPADGLGAGSAPGLVRVGRDPTEKARSALGEGTILVTPAQLLLAYSAIATGGNVFPLNRDGTHRRVAGVPPARRVNLKPKTLEVLTTGFEECVRSGTGRAAALPGIRIAGKTGTATALDGSRATHAWFAGYAPVQAPEIAVVVFLERGTGAHDAAALAGKIFRYYFREKDAETLSQPRGAQ